MAADNFGHPKGLLGRLMLVSMDKEHKKTDCVSSCDGFMHEAR